VHLDALTGKRLVRPEVPGDDGTYRFDHVLIRDTTYQSLLKRSRATLHERFVEWAERASDPREHSTEYDDILGYHLEQAHRYLAELGPLDDHGRELGVRGAQKLEAAGRRAFARGDMPAAANLLRRAANLRDPGDPERQRLLPLLAEALMEIGEFAWAETFLDDAEAGASDDPRLRANVELTRLFVRHRITQDLSTWRDDVLAVTERMIPELESMDAHEELAQGWRLLVYVHGIALQYGRQAEAGERAIMHARAAGDHRLEARLTAGYTIAICEGPTPVPQAIEICRGILGRHPAERQGEAIARCSLASLLAMANRIDDARVEYAAARDLLADLGGALPAYASIAAAGVELLAGNAEDVARDLRVVYGDLGRLGERFFRPLVGALLAEALQRLGDTAGAMAQVTEVAEEADASDVETWALLDGVRASVLAATGEPAAAVEAAQRAVDLLADTDAPVAHGHALVRLGETLAVVGRQDEARRALQMARRLYERKGNIAAAARLGETAAQPASS
jgi:tetratricopeptide (TPR) repeat protein